MADFTNDARLKDCPICKGHAHIAEVAFSMGAVLYFAACDNQGCRMFEVPGNAHYHSTVDGAVKAWNEMPRVSDMKAERDKAYRVLIDQSKTIGELVDGKRARDRRIAEQVREAAHGHYELCMVRDVEYEVKMDALLCRLTNGKWSKSRSYSLDFMVSCVDEEYETLHAKELAELGSGTCEAIRDEHTMTIVCSECGGGGLTIPNKGQKALRNFCPNCGRRIRKTVER